jgi:acetyl esterase/lipase
MGFRRRQVITAALTANALRPLPGFEMGPLAFFAGWLTSDLAPHLLAVTAADAGTHVTRSRRDPVGLLLAGTSAAALAYMIKQSHDVKVQAEDSLAEGLGVDYVEQLDEKPTPADLAVPWRRLVYPFRMRDRRVRVERDVVYNEEYGGRGKLDIYLPAEQPAEGAPVLLQIHGGGWTIGTKDQQGLPLMNHLAAKGWICVAPNYRLSPRNRWPAHIVDVKKSIAWIRENIADYGGNPDYIAITGGSAGGHLASLAALTPNDREWQPGFEDVDTSIQAAIPVYGGYDMAGATGTRAAIRLRDRFVGPRVFRASYKKHPEVFEAASPILRITPDSPDFFVLHGVHDTLFPVDQARQFVAKLREVSKRTVVYAEFPGTQHAFDVFMSIRTAHVVRAIDRYLHWHWNGYRRERAAS